MEKTAGTLASIYSKQFLCLRFQRMFLSSAVTSAGNEASALHSPHKLASFYVYANPGSISWYAVNAPAISVE